MPPKLKALLRKLREINDFLNPGIQTIDPRTGQVVEAVELTFPPFLLPGKIRPSKDLSRALERVRELRTKRLLEDSLREGKELSASLLKPNTLNKVMFTGEFFKGAKGLSILDKILVEGARVSSPEGLGGAAIRTAISAGTAEAKFIFDVIKKLRGRTRRNEPPAANNTRQR